MNIDLDSPGADMHLDLTKPLPFGDKSVEFIFSEHFIEHISRQDAVGLLSECHRVLTDNGTIRLSTPDLRNLAIAYLTARIKDWGDLWQPINPCHLLNEGMRFWGHQFLYDKEELRRLLNECGFASVRFVKWRESETADLACLEARPFHEELIVEATKLGFDIEIDEAFSERRILSSYSIEESKDVTSVIDTLASTVKEQGNRLSETVSHFIETEHALSAARQLLLNQTNHIKSLEVELAARTGHMAGLQQTIADQAAHIHSIDAEIIARGKHIAGLEQTIADQAAHIHSVDAEVIARGEHIAGLEQIIADKANEIQNLEVQLAHLKDSVNKLQGELNAIHGSWYGRLLGLKRKALQQPL